jgi:hypothetical protein
MIRKEHEFYESPVVMILETSSEGILCSSMKDNSFEGWGEEDLW